ncbi:MAG: tripartite tricarboxylate transporter substrate binding protein [Burkholderiales bacterium]
MPFQPGGATDVAARALGAVISRGIGQTVVIENRPGAQGVTGAVATKNSAPDGYTLGLLPSSVVCVAPYLRKNMPFETLKDFTPVGMIGLSPLALMVSSTLGPKTYDEFIRYAKANRGKLSYSSPGVGGSGHLYGALLDKAYDLDMQHVPFQGGVPAAQATAAGDVTMTMADLTSAQALLAAGKLLPLAIAGNQRWPTLPDMPTFSEVGLPVKLVGWTGILAPAGTPPAIVERLSAEMRKFTGAAEGREFLLRIGQTAAPTTPAEMATVLREGCPPWGVAARQAGIQPE